VITAAIFFCVLLTSRTPEQHDKFAFIDIEIDVPERVDLTFAHGVGLG
jgi:hypothetical protein